VFDISCGASMEDRLNGIDFGSRRSER
jgi:hypothetical protein